MKKAERKEKREEKEDGNRAEGRGQQGGANGTSPKKEKEGKGRLPADNRPEVRCG